MGPCSFKTMNTEILKHISHSFSHGLYNFKIHEKQGESNGWILNNKIHRTSIFSSL